MSASEKLKALMGVELAHGETRYPFNRRDVLEDALPLIVQVVEAAEAAGDYIIGSKISMEHPFVSERIRDIRAALSALDEALK